MADRPLWQFLAAAGFLVVPSLGVVQKYLGTDAAYAYPVAALAAAAVAWFVRARLDAAIARVNVRAAHLATAGLLFGLAIAFVSLYPTTVGGGSDRDEALNLAVSALVEGRNPYLEQTHLGNAISQLPGSFLLALPFALAGNAAWQNLFWFPVWLLVLRHLFGHLRGALFVVGLTLAASPVVLQDFVTGGDLATNSIVVLTIFALIHGGHPLARRPVASGLVTGVVVATRLPFVLLLPLMFVLVSGERGRKAGATHVAAALAACAALVLPFYLAGPSAFPPFEAQNKFGILAGVWPWAPVAVPLATAALAIGAAAAARGRTGPVLVAAGIVLGVPVLTLLAGMRLAGSWNMSPAVYAMPGLFFGLPGLWMLAGPRDRQVTPPRPPGAGRRRPWLRGALALSLVAAAGVGGRQLMNSRFHPFGESLSLARTSERVVALSFDDGPHPTNTPLMLDLLDRHSVKATFFMMGRNVERWPEVVRDVAARGHEVGNHSYSHPALIFMRPSRVREEIEQTDAALRAAGINGTIHFSPPHGSKLIVLPYVLREMGKLAVYSYTDPEEWKRPPAAVMVERVLCQVRPGAVVGFHDVFGGETLVAVDRIVETLKGQGYRFVTVSELAALR